MTVDDALTEPFATVGAAVVTPHPIRRVGRWLGGAALATVVGAAVAVSGVPAVTGATALTVLSGSMEPTLPVGSTVVVRPQPAAQIAVDDVITFTDHDVETGAPRTVTHRVIAVEPGVGGPTFRTKGDANEAPDPGLVEAADVRGVQWYVVPFVGLVKDRLFSRIGLFFTVGLALLVLAAHLLLPATSGSTTTSGATSGRAATTGRGRQDGAGGDRSVTVRSRSTPERNKSRPGHDGRSGSSPDDRSRLSGRDRPDEVSSIAQYVAQPSLPRPRPGRHGDRPVDRPLRNDRDAARPVRHP
jgi:signal peptidase